MTELSPRAGDGTPITSGRDVAPEVLELDRVSVVMGAAATNTFFEGHLDPAYAQRQGRRDIYLATGTIAGLVDRYVLAWLGSEAFLRSRSVRMRSSLCAGDIATVTGAVVSVDPGGSGRGRVLPTPVAVVTIDVTISNQAELCVTARVVVEVTLSGGAAS